MFDHSVENRQQFAHASDQRHLGSLTGVMQSFVESSDGSVTSAGNQGCHVEGCTYGGPTAPDSPTSSQGSAVTVKRRNADQGGNLFTIELSEFWQLRQQRTANDRTDAGDTSQQIFVFFADRALTDALIEIFVGTSKFRFQPTDVRFDTFSDRLGSCREAVSLGDDHLGELAPTGNQCAQFPKALIGQWAYRGTYCFGEAGQNHGIDGVSLGQLAGGFGKVSDLTRIDHHHAKLGTDQSASHVTLDSTCGFQHDQSRVNFSETVD